MSPVKKISVFLACLGLVGCATAPVVPRDTALYQKHMPKSILVLPPINNTPDIRATYGYVASTTMPIAEAGYYVLPIALVDQTFKENGISNAAEMHQVSAKKLRGIFGADAVMYITITEYGTKYHVISSVTGVAAQAKLVDLNTGALLWEGSAKQVKDSSSGSQSGLLNALINAAVSQVANQSKDDAHNIAQDVNAQLFKPTSQNNQGLLFGPRSIGFQK